MTEPGGPDPYQELPGSPVPPPAAAPPPGAHQPQPGYPPNVYPPGVYPPGVYPPGIPAVVYPEQSQAVGAIVVSALSLAVCGLLGPVGWQMGKKEREAIEAGRRDPANLGMARAAEIIGIVSSVILAVFVVFFILAFILPLVFLVFAGAAS